MSAQYQKTDSNVILGKYRFNTRHCLGEGSYGKVFEGLDVESGEQIAVKTIEEGVFKNDRYLQNAIMAEIEILKRFNHRNIVQFKDTIYKDGTIYIITEFCKDGDLRSFMKSQRNITETQIISIFTQILEGIRELHKVGVIHRDLKPANILINNDCFKIADFGFARDVDYASDKLLVSCVGSPMYMDPLILSRKPYGTKCDIWSLGVILYEMLQGETPYARARTEQELLMNIYTKPVKFDPLKPNVSVILENMVKQMLQPDEDKRVSWDELFAFFELEDPSNIEGKTTDDAKSIFDSFMQLRNMINYRHYITVELFENYQENKTFWNKDSIYDKLLFLISLSVKKESERIISILTEKESKNLLFKEDQSLIALSNSLRREHSFYQTIFNDVYNQMSINGILNVVNDESVVADGLLEKNLLTKEDLIGLNTRLGTFANQLSYSLLEQINVAFQNSGSNKTNNEKMMNALRCVHYLQDLFDLNNKKEMADNDQDTMTFENFHTTKSQFDSPYSYLLFLKNKQFIISSQV